MMKTFWILFCTLCTMKVYGNEGIENITSYQPAAWSPYIVGALIGLLTLMTFYFSHKPVGASSFFATLSGIIGSFIAKKHTKSLSYYKENPPHVNWEFIFILTALFGAFAAAWTGDEFKINWIPQMWQDHFGANSFYLRAIVGFFGGFLLAFGARLAGGCTSGHGISGTMQLNVSSWISVTCFFVSGVIIAHLLFMM